MQSHVAGYGFFKMLYNEDGTFRHYIISKRSIWSGLQAAEAKKKLMYEGYIYTPQKQLANDVVI